MATIPSKPLHSRYVNITEAEWQAAGEIALANKQASIAKMSLALRTTVETNYLAGSALVADTDFILQEQKKIPKTSGTAGSKTFVKTVTKNGQQVIQVTTTPVDKTDQPIPKIDPRDISAVEKDIQELESPPVAGTKIQRQEIMDRLKGSNAIPPDATKAKIGDKIVTTNPGLLSDEEFIKQDRTFVAGVNEARSALPRTEQVRATTSGQPAEGQRTVAAAEASEAARVASRLAALSPRTRAAFDATIAGQEKRAVEVAAQLKEKEEQREADRQALEMLKNQKEAELIQYKTAYFASPQVGIYIGDRWVGNAVTIEFTENVSKSPLYGYASTHFDAVAKGNVIVQGQFSIAYTGENYLPAILQRYRDTEGVGDSVPFLVKDPIERAKKLFWNLENINEPVKTLPLEYGYFEGKTGLVGNGFNIRVFYGSQNFLLDSFGTGSGNLKFEGPVQTILNVHLTSRSFIIQPTGDPIGESYTFFARNITTGVERDSINPNKVLQSKQGQTNIVTTSGTTPTNVRNEPNRGNP